MASQEIFRSDDVLVRGVTGMSNSVCFVTFDSYLGHRTSDHRTLDRQGFGQSFFKSRRIDAIHVISRDNRWYQYPELPAACQRIATLTSKYARVITYGSSMGGYAAIRFGAWVGASQAFAISPQFTANVYRWPFERRWFAEMKKAKILHERNIRQIPTVFVAYDPDDVLDMRHVACLKRRMEIVDIRCFGSGHPTTGFLADLDLLQESLLKLAHGEFDPKELEREALARREQSSQYYFTQAQRARSATSALAYAQKAVEIAPTHAPALANMALAAARARNYSQALEILEEAQALKSNHTNFHGIRARILESAGRIDEALAIVNDLAKINPIYGARLKILRAKKAVGMLMKRIRAS